MVPVRLGRHRRVLITGGSGVVASAMVRATPGDVALTVTRRRRAVGVPFGADVSVRTVELTDPIAVDRLLAEVRPDVVVHAAASISDAADVVIASDVVTHGAARHGAELVHLSSDAVFAGDAAPYAEGDLPDPVHDYGRWKAEAEQLARAAVPDVCITRTSLVVSVDPPDRTVERVLDGARRAAAGEQQLPRWFHDELRCPIRASDLADQLWALVELPRSATGGGLAPAGSGGALAPRDRPSDLRLSRCRPGADGVGVGARPLGAASCGPDPDRRASAAARGAHRTGSLTDAGCGPSCCRLVR